MGARSRSWASPWRVGGSLNSTSWPTRSASAGSTWQSSMRDSSRRKENGMQSEAITYERLRAALTGRVIGPDDQDYDEARTIFYGGFDRSPAAIARVADANDVARAVRFAAETGTELAVRSGGHSVAGHGSTDGGIVLDLLAAEIVTADGELLRIDERTDPDLFWAIRGGGGNFGVVTRFRFRLHELPSVVGGILILPATPDVVASFVEAAVDAPEELSTIANVLPAPPMPFVPEEHHGKLVVMALMAFA